MGALGLPQCSMVKTVPWVTALISPMGVSEGAWLTDLSGTWLPRCALCTCSVPHWRPGQREGEPSGWWVASEEWLPLVPSE